ncbi:MAG: CvpA family protein [Desulfitobacteriaceae bacterium]
MNIVDVLIIGIALLGALQGYRRGLLSGIASFIGTVGGFLLASMKYEAVLVWLEQHFPLQGWLEPIIYKIVWAQVQTQSNGMDSKVLDKILALFPLELRSLVSNGNSSSLQSVTQGVLEQAAHRLAGILTENLLRLVAFALVFYFIFVIVHLVIGLVLRPLGRLGGTLNHGGGFIFGGITAIIALAVLAGLLSPVLGLGLGAKTSAIKDAYLYPYLLRVFQGLDQVFSLQLVSRLLEPLSFKNILPH